MADLVEEIISNTDFFNAFNKTAKSQGVEKTIEDGYEEFVSYVEGSREAGQNCKTYLEEIQSALQEHEKAINLASTLILDYLRKEHSVIARGFGIGIETKQNIKRKREIGQLTKDLKEVEKLIGELDKFIDTIEIKEKKLELAAKAAKAAKKQQEEDEAERQRKDEEQRKREEEKEKSRQEKEKRQREEEDHRRKEEELRMKEEEERRAREAEERRIREERRKREEEERRKREREEREKEEKERQKNNPENWPPKVFTSNENNNDELAGTIRVRRDKTDVDSFDLTEEPLDFGNIFHGKYGERAVSNIVRLRAISGRTKCQPELHLSIPEKFRADRETPSSHWTLIVYERTKHGEVKEHTPESLHIPDIEGTRFTNISLDEVEDSVFQVFARLKTETWKHDHREGAQISPNMDSRVSVDIPASAYANDTSIKTQLIPVTRDDISNVRTKRIKSVGPLSNLSGSSPILHIAAPIPADDLNVEMPVQTVERNDSSNDLTSGMHLMVSSRKGAWANNIYQEIRHDDEKAKFGIKEAVSQYTRMMVLRTNGHASAESLEEMAKALEKHKLETACSFVVKQKSDMPGEISMTCQKRENTITTIERLEKQGFAKGPAESQEFYLKEGQVLEIRTKPNIKFDEKKSIRMIFYSNIDTAKKQDFISAVDSYTQREYPEYRGYVSLYKCNGDSEGSYYVDKDDPTSFICELPLTLPKLPRETTMVEKANFKINADAPPVTEEYFDEIKKELAVNWKSLAKALGISPSFAHQAYNNHENSPQREADATKDILVAWYKTCTRGDDKVKPLIKAFMNIGRNDIAKDLLDRDGALKENKPKSAVTKSAKNSRTRAGPSRSSRRK